MKYLKKEKIMHFNIFLFKKKNEKEVRTPLFKNKIKYHH